MKLKSEKPVSLSTKPTPADLLRISMQNAELIKELAQTMKDHHLALATMTVDLISHELRLRALAGDGEAVTSTNTAHGS